MRAVRWIRFHHPHHRSVEVTWTTLKLMATWITTDMYPPHIRFYLYTQLLWLRACKDVRPCAPKDVLHWRDFPCLILWLALSNNHPVEGLLTNYALTGIEVYMFFQSLYIFYGLSHSARSHHYPYIVVAGLMVFIYAWAFDKQWNIWRVNLHDMYRTYMTNSKSTERLRIDQETFKIWALPF